ncbi:YjjG family noncanonical pyrimidine nucleotidase [Flavobacteriales bacterium]|nr:YjjG family noncanonical pyrimidine nucleotidase [Flavobacteriales bacterium]MDC3338240.1 YjjG family noncanonical pyrimidine nucleotidase [Flavobacteriales bacterium]
MKLKDVKHVFWDLDHTLWDFDLNSSDTLHELFIRYNLENELKTQVDEFISAYKRINDSCWDKYRNGLMTKDELRLARFSLTFSHFDAKGYDRAEEFGWMYMEECPKKSKLIPGTVEVLNYLKGKYTQHIITNGFLEVQGIKQVASGLKSYFDVVVCSEEVGEKKPHPSVFKYALEKAGANGSESVMIGDNLEVDALGAQNAGLTGIWFNPKQKSIPHSVVEIIELEELFHIL